MSEELRLHRCCFTGHRPDKMELGEKETKPLLEKAIDEAIANAMGCINENEEKEALLKAYAVQEANRVVTTLWRLQILPENMEKEYRALPAMKEMADTYNEFTSARKERMDAIMDQHKAIAEEEKDLDIFKGIVNGIPAKESEKRYEEFKNAQQQAMAGGR